MLPNLSSTAISHFLVAHNKKNSYWNIETGNSETLLCQIAKIAGINSSIYYLGGTLNSFLYQNGDEKTASISCIVSGPAKVCYVVPSSFKVRFETFAAKELLNPLFTDSYKESARNILATQTILSNESAISFFSQNVKMSKIVQRCNLFIILSVGVYHESFSMDYNLAKATNTADFS